VRPPRAAYKRGAKFVDVAYFDPYLKRVRIESADPDTLDFVPQWYGERVLEHAEQNGARISMRGVTAPHVLDGLDKSLLGKDMLPSVKGDIEGGRRALDQLVLRPGAASGVGGARPSRSAGGRGVSATLAGA
jgi:aminopeptidase